MNNKRNVYGYNQIEMIATGRFKGDQYAFLRTTADIIATHDLSRDKISQSSQLCHCYNIGNLHIKDILYTYSQ